MARSGRAAGCRRCWRMRSCHAVLTLAITLVTVPRLWWLSLIDLAVHLAIDRSKTLLAQRGGWRPDQAAVLVASRVRPIPAPAHQPLAGGGPSAALSGPARRPDDPSGADFSGRTPSSLLHRASRGLGREGQPSDPPCTEAERRGEREACRRLHMARAPCAMWTWDQGAAPGGVVTAPERATIGM